MKWRKKTNELKPEKCEKECLYLTRNLNDNYIIEQVKTRTEKAEKLKKAKEKGKKDEQGSKNKKELTT